MHSFYENQHPEHTERRRQALRDAAAHDRLARPLRHAAEEDASATSLPAAERRQLPAPFAATRAIADEIRVDLLGAWGSDPLAPDRSRRLARREAFHGYLAWALTTMVVVSIVVAGVWP